MRLRGGWFGCGGAGRGLVWVLAIAGWLYDDWALVA